MDKAIKKNDRIALCGKDVLELIATGSIKYRQNQDRLPDGHGVEDGDVLWVQEHHARTERKDFFTRPHYFADGRLLLEDRHDAGLLKTYSASDMPEWASRMSVVVSDVKTIGDLVECKVSLLRYLR